MVQSDISSVIYVGNNSTVVPYPVGFVFQNEEDLVVVVRAADGTEDTQLLGTDYTLTGVGNPDGGSLVTTWPVPATSHVSIARMVPMTQLTAYEEGDSFPAKSHERALDKLTHEVQQLARGMGSGAGGADDLGTAFRLTDASGGIKALPKVLDSVVGIDANGDAILRTPSNALSWLGQVGASWANSGERANTRGAFAGQTGVQRDNWTIYVARSTVPGDWVPHLQESGVVISTNGTPSAKPNPAGDIVGTTEAQTLANKTLSNPAIHNPTGLTPADVGLGNVSNVPPSLMPISDPVQTALNQKQDLNVKGLSNGYASLDGAAKVPIEQLPSEFLGARSYQGTWNASTNSPTIPAASAGNAGNYYVVSVAGSSTPPGGPSSWAVGDMVISNGTIWQKVPVSSAVVSVAGKTGVVTLVKGDVGLGNVDNTSDVTKNAATATLTNKTISGANNTLTVRLANDVTGNLPTARLNGGTGAAANTWWCGDGTWKQPSGTGDVSGVTASVDGQLPVFDGIGGKTIRAYSGPAGILMTSGNVVSSDVHALTEKVEVVDDDEVVIWDSVTGTLMKVRKKNFGIPVGVILDFGGSTLPTGWLWCDGHRELRTAYPALFAVIGNVFGSGSDPATEFTIPDLRGFVCAGRDNMGATGDSGRLSSMGAQGDNVGGYGGAQSHQLSVAEMPGHTHLYGTHVHSYTFQALIAASGFQGGPHYNVSTVYNNTAGPNVHPDSAGGGALHNNLQPTCIVNKIIKY